MVLVMVRRFQATGPTFCLRLRLNINVIAPQHTTGLNAPRTDCADSGATCVDIAKQFYASNKQTRPSSSASQSYNYLLTHHPCYINLAHLPIRSIPPWPVGQTWTVYAYQPPYPHIHEPPLSPFF